MKYLILAWAALGAQAFAVQTKTKCYFSDLSAIEGNRSQITHQIQFSTDGDTAAFALDGDVLLRSIPISSIRNFYFSTPEKVETYKKGATVFLDQAGKVKAQTKLVSFKHGDELLSLVYQEVLDESMRRENASAFNSPTITRAMLTTQDRRTISLFGYCADFNSREPLTN